MGCGSSSPELTETIEDLFPMKIGNYWTYHDQDFENNTDETTPWEIRTIYDTLGHHVYPILNNGIEYDFYYRYEKVYFDIDRPQLFLQYPLNPGHAAALFGAIQPYGSDWMESNMLFCESVNETVDLGFEKFNCIKYSLFNFDGTQNKKDIPDYAYAWFAMHKGLVKYEHYRQDSLHNAKLVFMRELKGYRVE